ncbi:MAG: 16S rRNA (uracil(1498)-N(3))-methyltransferase [Acidobacteria bacterium]|nr:16S rRNA (uracil(1498)-N(3))-methyltransferase [Acidobacteriota bacterium]
MLPRFYAPDLDPELASVSLPGDEARHLTRALRLGAGAEVTVFNGRGVEFRAVVEATGRETATVRLLEPMAGPPAPSASIVVVQAVLKGSSMDDAVRDATMMGADAIAPVLTAHVDIKVSLIMRPETAERWRRVALASVKQCRRTTLPEIHPPRKLAEWLATPFVPLRLIFVEPSAACAPRSVASLQREAAPGQAAVLLGPEGGWDESEIRSAVEHGCVPVQIGPLTLRAETMPVAALAALTAIWQ